MCLDFMALVLHPNSGCCSIFLSIQDCRFCKAHLGPLPFPQTVCVVPALHRLCPGPVAGVPARLPPQSPTRPLLLPTLAHCCSAAAALGCESAAAAGLPAADAGLLLSCSPCRVQTASCACWLGRSCELRLLPLSAGVVWVLRYVISTVEERMWG